MTTPHRTNNKQMHCALPHYRIFRILRQHRRCSSDILERLANPIAIGHVRYSTTGSSKLANSQPLLIEYSRGQVAIAHNGNLINASLLRDEYEAYGSIFKSTSDTEVISHLLAKPTHISKHDCLAGLNDKLS